MKFVRGVSIFYTVWCACVDGISFTLKFIARTRMTHDSVTCTEHLSHSLCISRFKYSMKFFDAIFFAFFFFFIFFGEFFAFRFYRLLLVVVMLLSHMCYVVWGIECIECFSIFFFSFCVTSSLLFGAMIEQNMCAMLCVHLEQTQYNFIRCCFVHFKYTFQYLEKSSFVPPPPPPIPIHIHSSSNSSRFTSRFLFDVFYHFDFYAGALFKRTYST